VDAADINPGRGRNVKATEARRSSDLTLINAREVH
jgi:hypothetical protein